MRRRRQVQAPPPDRNEPRVNRRIRVPRVLVIDEEGKKLGEFLTEDAVKLAQDRGLDLIEVAPNGRPPVCKIADYGQMKYEKKKKDAVARKNQVQVQLKEIKVRPKTDEHDMNVKVKHARSFLDEGNKVKVTVRFRGRELAHRDIGEQQCFRIAQEVKDIGLIESPPRMDGRQMFMILAPTKRPVVRPRAQQSDDEYDDVQADEVEDEDDDVEDEVEQEAGAEA